MNPLISIISPYRDSRLFLESVVSTVRNQTYSNWELLLIDDCSLDGGPRLAELLACQDSRIRCISSPIRGKEDTDGPWWPRNYGISCCTGSLIAFLDVDDLWHPAKLERQVQHLYLTKSDICITGYARFTEGRSRLNSWRLPPPIVDYARLRRGNVIPMLTVLIRRDLIVNGFQPVNHEDYLFWLDTFKVHPSLLCTTVPELLAFHRRHGRNLTSSRIGMAAWAYSVFRRHGCSHHSSLQFLADWFINQCIQYSRSLGNPLSYTLSDALQGRAPISLPPML